MIPVRSNTFTVEWPPRSGVIREFPEVDRAQWFALAEARRKINLAQVVFLERLREMLEGKGDARIAGYEIAEPPHLIAPGASRRKPLTRAFPVAGARYVRRSDARIAQRYRLAS